MGEEPDSSSACVSCAGSFVGTVAVPTAPDATVGLLRHKVAFEMGTTLVHNLQASTHRSPCSGLDASHAPSLKLILGGRTLKDDDQPLAQLRITPTTRLMVLHSAPAVAALQVEESRRARLETLQATVKALSMRNGTNYSDQPELTIENQGGATMHFPSEVDRSALTIGLMLHAKGTSSMRQVIPYCNTLFCQGISMCFQGNFAVALDELHMADEALDLCDRSVLQGIDNVALLMLDIVWYASLSCCNNKMTHKKPAQVHIPAGRPACAPSSFIPATPCKGGADAELWRRPAAIARAAWQLLPRARNVQLLKTMECFSTHAAFHTGLCASRCWKGWLHTTVGTLRAH